MAAFMPILPAEPATYPECLFDVPESERVERRWWVLHTKPRQEKALSRQLREQKAPFFLPLGRRWLKVRGRTLTSFVPLFPGYLFLLANDNERSTAIYTGRIVQSLLVVDQGRLWRELRQINRLLESGLPVTPEQGLIPGTMVEILTGPLMGLRGKVLRTASGNRFVVQVDFIQRGASVVLEGCELAPVIPEGSPSN
jgi:transcriptional antiterminator RfaH